MSRAPPTPEITLPGTVAAVELRGDVSAVAGRVTVALTGIADLATVPALRDVLVRAATDHPSTPLFVDLDAVEVLDDVALGILLGAAGRCRAAGGDLVVVASRSPLLARLTATGFDRAVRVVPALTEVVS